MPYVIFSNRVGTGSGPTTIVEDTFTDTNGVLIENHTPEVGGPWERGGFQGGPILSGQVFIQNNGLAINVNEQAAVIDTGQPDHTLEVDWITATGVNNRNSIILRYINGTSHVHLNIREPNQDIQLSKYTTSAGTTVIQNTSYPFVAGQTYNFRIISSGINYQVYINDVLTLTGSDSLATGATKVGLARNAGSSQTLFDNFKVSV